MLQYLRESLARGHCLQSLKPRRVHRPRSYNRWWPGGSVSISVKRRWSIFPFWTDHVDGIVGDTNQC